MITVRKMKPVEKDRLSELDRCEEVSAVYRMNGGKLEKRIVDWKVPQWDIREKLAEWEPIVEGYRHFWGAFSHGRLVGFSVYRSELEPLTGQLALLHVDSGARGKGVGSALLERVIEQAIAEGKAGLYVSSISTASSVDFYMSRGFRLTDEPNPELHAMEPEDIHMRMDLTTVLPR